MNEPRVTISDSSVKAAGFSEISKPELAPDIVDFISKSVVEGLNDTTYFVRLVDQLSNGAPVFEKPIKKGDLPGKFAHCEGTLVANKRTNSIQLLRPDRINAEFKAIFTDSDLHVSYCNDRKPGLVSAKYKDSKAYEAECNVPLSHDYTLNIKASFYNKSDTFITGGKGLDKAVIKSEKDKKLLDEGNLLKDSPVYTLILPDGVRKHLQNAKFIERLILDFNIPDPVAQALQLWTAERPNHNIDKSIARI